MDNIIYNENGYSNCCGASVLENTDRCTKCGEHCEIIEHEEDN